MTTKLKKKTLEIFKRCYENSGWFYDDAVFLSRKSNWKNFQQYTREREENK